MQFIPLNFLIIWLIGLLSLGVLSGGIYIIYELYEGELVYLSYLVGGIALVLCSIAGRFISLPLLRRRGTDEPKFMRTGTMQRLTRPDGSIFMLSSTVQPTVN